MVGGGVAGAASRSRGGRCARRWPIVRFLQRAVPPEVVEDGADGVRIFDAGDDAHAAAAMGAGGHVDVEDALEALRPGHGAPFLCRRSIIRAGDFSTRRPAAFAAMRGRELGAQVRVRGEDAVEAGQVRARWRDQRRQEFFKKEAWFAASLVGMEVRGYQPTDFERERLARSLAARRNPAAPEAVAVSAEPRSAERVPESGGAPAPRPQGSDLIVGRLVDHGAAPYGHDPKQPMSYFVRVETARGDREIWGVDLERAFRQSLSTPGIGDEIGVRSVGRQPVTVLAPKLDAQGRETGQAPLDTHRNQWIVERKNFLDERQRMAEVLRNAETPAADGIRRHPELEGSYLQLQMGRALAEQQFRDKAQREQFVDHLRSHIAQRIEFGQPLDPVMLRGEERTVSPRSQDRDFQPTR